MDYETQASDPVFPSQSGLSEDCDSTLEMRVDAAEYRLERTLVTLNRYQRALADLNERFQKLVEIQADAQSRQDRLQTHTRCSLCAILALFFVSQITPLASVGWQMLNTLTEAFQVEMSLAAGLLFILTALLLTGILIGHISRLIQRRRGHHAVCDG